MRIGWVAVLAAVACDPAPDDTSGALVVDCTGQGAVVAIDEFGEVVCGAPPDLPDFGSFGSCPDGDFVVGINAAGQVVCDALPASGDVTSAT